MKRLIPIILAVILLCTACTAAASPEERAALSDVLTMIDTRMQPGTAGSSLTAAYLAATLMDWSRETTLDEKTIAEITEEVLAQTDPNAPASYAEKLRSVYHAYELLMTEQGADILSDCGYSGNGYPWNESDMTALHTVMHTAELE